MENENSTQSLTDLGPQDRDLSFPMSFPQQRPWFLNELHPNSAAYNIPLGCRFEGSLNRRALDDTLTEVVRRHEILRTVYRTQPDGPVQTVKDPFKVVTTLVPCATEGEALEAFHREARTAIDLENAPGLRPLLFQISPTDHILMLGLHHIACDAWSLGLLAREISLIYSAITSGQPHTLPEPELQYGDFAEWQREQALSGTFDEALSYWLDKLEQAPAQIELYTDRPRPATQSYTGSHVRFEIPRELADACESFAAANSATPFTVYLAAYSILLSRWSDGASPVIGTPVAGRTHSVQEGMIGFFTNTLVLTPQLGGDPSFADLVRCSGQEVRQALAHQDLPFEILVEKLNPERDPAHSPLFQVMFILWEEQDDAHWDLSGLKTTTIEGDSASSKFDLTLSLKQTPDAVTARLEYATALFDAETVQRLADQYTALLADLISHPDLPVSRASNLSAAEQKQVQEFSTGPAVMANTASVVERIHLQCSSAPSAPALTDARCAICYADLKQRSDALAQRLQSLGVVRGSIIGVYIDRSVDAVVAMHAIQKCGAAYLPMDPSYPADRLKFMTEDAQVSLIVSDAKGSAAAAGFAAAVVPVDAPSKGTDAAPQEVPLDDGDLAYVIYTSGSTGTPKGVEITHGNLRCFLDAMDETLGEDRPGTWLAVTSISFDISVLELFWTLTRGYHVVIKSDEQQQDIAKPDTTTRPLELGFHFFGNTDDAGQPAKGAYDLVLDTARFADKNGFASIWTPERHFHRFGGLYPNPAVLGAAIAAVTEHVNIRAGSVVLPLHDPLEVAEQWALLDNISGGRTGVSFASGWAPNDFVIAPENYENRKAHMLNQIEDMQTLWSGGTVSRQNGLSQPTQTAIFPKPIQSELPFWITSARHPETFEMAGKTGGGILTHLVGQSIDELAEKIAIYRDARTSAGHEGDGHVAVMLHTYLHKDPDIMRQTVQAPLSEYIQTSFDLMKSLGASFRTDTNDLSSEEISQLAGLAVDRFVRDHGLFGTPEDAAERMADLSAIGVDEVGCLIDFGIDAQAVRDNLPLIAEAKALHEGQTRRRGVDFSDTANMIRTFGVTHMQCTPTTASVLADMPEQFAALAMLDRMLVGGEALPPSLAERLSSAGIGQVTNMYGPTEATIWATSADIKIGAPVTIGSPLPGYKLRIHGKDGCQVPIGVPGELLLGGSAIARGYLHRQELTAERFVDLGEADGVQYRTGDLVKFNKDGKLVFLGRNDSQIKLRGRRIEIGEIEAKLEHLPQVREAAVRLWGDGEARAICGYVTLSSDALSTASHDVMKDVAKFLPTHMVPSGIVILPQMPKTSNGKIDRKALPDHQTVVDSGDPTGRKPDTEMERLIAEIWETLLDRSPVMATDNFFQIGGNSILVIRMRNLLVEKLGRTLSLVDLFRHSTLEKLAQALSEEVPVSAVVGSDKTVSKARDAHSRLARMRRTEAAE